MKILVVSHTYITPINRDKWKTLARLYPQVSLIVVFPKHWPTHLFIHKANIAHDEHSNNCTFIALDTHTQGNELLYTYHHAQLYNLIKTLRPEIIHVEQGDSALSYLQINIYKKMLRLPALSTFFTWINWLPKHSFKHRLVFTAIEKINHRCSAGAIAGNQQAKELLEQKGPRKPIIVLPQLGINTALFRPCPKKQHAEYNTIAFIGRLTEEKGIFLLAQAFEKLYVTFPQWKLLFVGTGPAEQKLQAFLYHHEMESRVEFRNPIPHDQVAALLQTIDILVLPSYDTPTWREQFGHILIEAMACAVPVIGSNAGEIPNVIADTGFIFEQKNESDLRKQLHNLMSNEGLRETLGILGLERVQQEYTHEIIAQKTYAFWHNMLRTNKENSNHGLECDQ